MGASCSSCKSNNNPSLKLDLKCEKNVKENTCKITNNIISVTDIKETYFSNFNINKEGNPKIEIETIEDKVEFLIKFCNFKMANIMIECQYLISIKILKYEKTNSKGDESDDNYQKLKKIEQSEIKEEDNSITIYSKIFKGEESKLDIEYFNLFVKEYDKLIDDFVEIVSL